MEAHVFLRPPKETESEFRLRIAFRAQTGDPARNREPSGYQLNLKLDAKSRTRARILFPNS